MNERDNVVDVGFLQENFHLLTTGYEHAAHFCFSVSFFLFFSFSSELERNGKTKRRRKVCAKSFTEGWVEFEKKKVGKYVASVLNNRQISTRKKSKFYDIVWNIKYLPR